MLSKLNKQSLKFSLRSNYNIFFRITLLDKVLFTKHLSVMLKSGIPLSEAITSLKDQTNNPAFKAILVDILSEVENGQSLEKALSKHPKVFDALYLSLVATGEKSGNLEENLEYLAAQLKKTYSFNKKIAGATLYPKLVISAALIMGGSLALFVLPNLVRLFESLDVELPLTTKILLYLANLMKNFGYLIVSGIAVLGFLFTLLLKTPFVKPKWHKFLLTAPIFGALNQNIELAQICRDLGIMLKSGLTLPQALDTQCQATENLTFKKYLADLLKGTEKGKKLADQMNAEKLVFIPVIVPKMIGVGEETGKLDEVLLYLGDFFEEEVDDVTANLSSTLEPILLLIIGAVVAFIALAIISPIYQLAGSIKK